MVVSKLECFTLNLHQIVFVFVHFHFGFQSLMCFLFNLLYLAFTEFPEFHLVEAQLKMELAEMVHYLRVEVCSCCIDHFNAVSDLDLQSILTLLLISDVFLSLLTHSASNDVTMILGLEVSCQTISLVGFCSFCL